MNQTEFYGKYGAFFESCAAGSAINPIALANISNLLTQRRPDLLKANNFFAIQRAGQYRRFATPFEGIKAGIDLLTGNKQFALLKIGTLKANPDKQYERLKTVLDIV